MAAFGLINEMNWGGGHDSNWDGPNFGGGMLGVAAIPVTIGLAFIVLSFFNKNKD